MACDGPVSAMSIGGAFRCFWEKGSNAVTGVIQSPGSATITDWALALFAILIAVNVLSLILRILVPRLAIPLPLAQFKSNGMSH